MVRWGETANGTPYIDWEPDQRHAEIVTKHFRLHSGAKAVGSPGVKRTAEDYERATELEPEQAAAFRSLCMRVN